MASPLPYDSDYERVMLTIAGNESRALSAHSKMLRGRAAEAVKLSQQLRARCATLSTRLSRVLRQSER